MVRTGSVRRGRTLASLGAGFLLGCSQPEATSPPTPARRVEVARALVTLPALPTDLRSDTTSADFLGDFTLTELVDGTPCHEVLLTHHYLLNIAQQTAIDGTQQIRVSASPPVQRYGNTRYESARASLTNGRLRWNARYLHGLDDVFVQMELARTEDGTLVGEGTWSFKAHDESRSVCTCKASLRGASARPEDLTRPPDTARRLVPAGLLRNDGRKLHAAHRDGTR